MAAIANIEHWTAHLTDTCAHTKIYVCMCVYDRYTGTRIIHIERNHSWTPFNATVLKCMHSIPYRNRFAIWFAISELVFVFHEKWEKATKNSWIPSNDLWLFLAIFLIWFNLVHKLSVILASVAGGVTKAYIGLLLFFISEQNWENCDAIEFACRFA